MAAPLLHLALWLAHSALVWLAGPASLCRQQGLMGRSRQLMLRHAQRTVGVEGGQLALAGVQGPVDLHIIFEAVRLHQRVRQAHSVGPHRVSSPVVHVAHLLVVVVGHLAGSCPHAAQKWSSAGACALICRQPSLSCGRAAQRGRCGGEPMNGVKQSLYCLLTCSLAPALLSDSLLWPLLRVPTCIWQAPSCEQWQACTAAGRCPEKACIGF